MGRPLAAAVIAATLLIRLPAIGSGETTNLLDYDVANGHFFTQSNGAPTGTSARGYSISDDFGIPFWSEFQRLGGVEHLGYPVTRRFVWHGLIGQATQKAVLQYSPETRRVQLVNVLDYLAAAGKEDWLQQDCLVPPTMPGMVELTDPASIVRWLAQQGDATMPFRRFYASAADPMLLYGVPTSPPRDLGDVVAVRFQRTVLQLWKVSGPGIKAGTVTALNSGEVIKASGLLPVEVLEPQEPPSLEMRELGRSREASIRGGTAPLHGVATWYGAAFQGRRMRNGDFYDLEDPTIAASNGFPLGTRLRVTNLGNGASVEVTVTDTGAFRYPIVVDLSWAAFNRLDDPAKGVIDVLVLPLRRD